MARPDAASPSKVAAAVAGRAFCAVLMKALRTPVSRIYRAAKDWADSLARETPCWLLAPLQFHAMTGTPADASARIIIRP